jgi:hypothetical protein
MPDSLKWLERQVTRLEATLLTTDGQLKEQFRGADKVSSRDSDRWRVVLRLIEIYQGLRHWHDIRDGRLARPETAKKGEHVRLPVSGGTLLGAIRNQRPSGRTTPRTIERRTTRSPATARTMT